MDLLTILPILENYNRIAVSTTNGDTIAYNGDINTVTVNNDTINDAYNLVLTPTTDVCLQIHYTSQKLEKTYKIEDINTLTIT